jgi:DNA-binding NarL/FixJ family response regulator
MSKSASTPYPGSRSGPGRKPIPDDAYLIRWSGIVESLKAGQITAEINVKYETCGETVRRVRRIMEDGGWIPPKRERIKVVSPKRESRPPKAGMTTEERLVKYPRIVGWLRAGKTMVEIAAREGVSVNTVKVVRRALAAQMR